MGVKGLMIGGTLTLMFALATFESCTNAMRDNEDELDRDKSTQFSGDISKNFVENTAAFVGDGVEALANIPEKVLTEESGKAAKDKIDKMSDSVKSFYKGFTAPDCDDVRNMALLRECWEVEP